VWFQSRSWHSRYDFHGQAATREMPGTAQGSYAVFVDLTKAFDSVNREGLWKVLSKIGCPAKFIAIVRSFHDGMMGRVSDNGATSDSFLVTT